MYIYTYMHIPVRVLIIQVSGYSYTIPVANITPSQQLHMMYAYPDWAETVIGSSLIHDSIMLCISAPANCNEGQIRLAGSRSSLREGRVEICIDRVWGTVCDRRWDSREARVVCRQLGYTSLGE